MVEHKEDCEFMELEYSLIARNDYAPDEKLSVDCNGIRYNPNFHISGSIEDTIEFYYCPMCGIKYE